MTHAAVRTRFEAHYEPLADDRPGWGRAAVLPWDAEVFGFAVGDYEAGNTQEVSGNVSAVRERLFGWASRNDVELISCGLGVEQSAWLVLLPPLGFQFVEYSLRATLTRLQSASIPESRIPVRLAAREDWDALERIAGTAFRVGRYHADARFPAAMADLRYRQWVRRALTATDSGDRVYVLGSPGQARGFFHVVVAGELADLRLGAVDTSLDAGIAGFSLYAGTLAALKQIGARQAIAKIQAANTAVMNIYSALGFRFSHPEAVFHWHALEAPHLLGADRT